LGQKVNPIGLRLGINQDWRSKWYAGKSDYGALLNEDAKIRDYIKEKLYFYKKAINQLEERLVLFLKEKRGITTQEFKELTGVTRKYAIPLLNILTKRRSRSVSAKKGS
jgi:small subunit ribosomal protein S3